MLDRWKEKGTFLEAVTLVAGAGVLLAYVGTEDFCICFSNVYI